MNARFKRAKVVSVSLDQAITPIEIEARYDAVVLVVSVGGMVIGEVTLGAEGGLLEPGRARGAIQRELGAELWRERFRSLFERAARGSGRDQAVTSPAQTVSVIVCTRDRPDDLRRCLRSLTELRRRPQEIFVVDSAPSDGGGRQVCAEFSVTYLHEPVPGASRARNRAILAARTDLVAITDDDCVVDPGWLDRLEDAFFDPLVQAVTGYIGPLELEGRGQVLFEAHGGFERQRDVRVLDMARMSPIQAASAAGASANAIFRRRSFSELGLFAEDLGPGTPARSCEDRYAFYRIVAAGYRIVFDPRRVVWHRHRRDEAALAGILSDYAIADSAYLTRCLIRHHETAALPAMRWWVHHIRREVERSVRRSNNRMPRAAVWAEGVGLVKGPWKLLQSSYSRRGTPSLELTHEVEIPDSADRRARVGVGAGVPTLSVTIPSHNRRDSLTAVLRSLSDQDYPSERFEVVVVLDGSDDGSAQAVRSIETPYRLRVLEQENRGLAVTRNRGAREADEEIVVFLDDDILPEPGFLAAHAGAHRAAGEDHVALGSYPPIIRDSSYWAMELRWWWEDHFRRKAEPGHVWTFRDFCDGNCSMPRSLWQETGGWDETFRGGRRQDYEYAVRLLQGGRRFGYYPDARGWHNVDTTFATALRNSRQEARWDVLLASKHPQLKAQLPLAGAARPRGGKRRQTAAAYRDPHSTERAVHAALPALNALEGLRLRRRWRQLALRLLSLSYAVGVSEALPSGDFDALFPAGWRQLSGTTVDIALDDRGPVAIDGAAGPIDLRLELGGIEVARVRAVPPDSQWEWKEVTDRVFAQASPSVYQSLAMRALEEASGLTRGRDAVER